MTGGLVMEQADRIEELVDGHMAGVGGAEVWRHVQAKERSPFAAPLPGHTEQEAATAATPAAEAARLSSLVGADHAQFRRPAEEAAPPTPAPEPETAPAGDDGDDDVMRWAPPGRR